MKQLKTVMVGAGRIGWQYHMPSMVKHGGFLLAAAADPLADRREETEREFHIRTYDDAIRMFDSERPDLAVIASPSHMHAEQAIAAMERGIDVFVDKPMANTLADGDRMIRKMEETGRKLMVYQPMRANRMTMAIKSILSSRKLGELYMIKFCGMSYTRRNDWQALRKYGGGYLNNAGSHYVDVILHLAGSPAASVACHMKRVASLGDAEDVLKILLKTESGVILDLDVNYASAAENLPEWTLLGSQGAAVYHADEDGHGYFDLKYFDRDDLPDRMLNEGTAAPDREYMRDPIPWKRGAVRLDSFEPLEFYDHCYDYFALGKPPFVPVAQTREVLRVIEQCRVSDGGFLSAADSGSR